MGARFAGLRVDFARVVAFMLAGLGSAGAGVLLTTRTGSAADNGGDSYLLSSVAAAFFGSAVLRDGKVHCAGTVIGVITGDWVQRHQPDRPPQVLAVSGAENPIDRRRRDKHARASSSVMSVRDDAGNEPGGAVWAM